MGNEAVASVAFVSLAANAKIFIIFLVGIGLAKYPRDAPLLQQDVLRSLSKLSNLVLLPALIVVSLGSALSIKMVARMSIMIAFCVLTNLVSFSIVYTLGSVLAEADVDLLVAVSVAVGSPNAISFPLMLCQTLCETQLVNVDFGGDAVLCMTEANAQIFVYSIGWHVCFWSYGWPLLKSLAIAKSPQGPGKMVELAPSYPAVAWLQQTLLSPSMIAIYVGLLVGLVPSLQNALFRDFTALRPLGSALRTLSEPVVCINTLVTAANLAQIDSTSLRGFFQRVQDVVSTDAMGWYYSHYSHAPRVEVASPLHAVESGVPAALPTPPDKAKNAQQEAPPLPQYRTVFSFLLCRLVLPPLIMLPVLRLAVDAGWIDRRERLMQLVVCIESAAPSAQLIIVSCTQLGNRKVAAQMSFLYVCQYAFSVISVTILISVAMATIY